MNTLGVLKLSILLQSPCRQGLHSISSIGCKLGWVDFLESDFWKKNLKANPNISKDLKLLKAKNFFQVLILQRLKHTFYNCISYFSKQRKFVSLSQSIFFS